MSRERAFSFLDDEQERRICFEEPSETRLLLAQARAFCDPSPEIDAGPLWVWRRWLQLMTHERADRMHLIAKRKVETTLQMARPEALIRRTTSQSIMLPHRRASRGGATVPIWRVTDRDIIYWTVAPTAARALELVRAEMSLGADEQFEVLSCDEQLARESVYPTEGDGHCSMWLAYKLSRGQDEYILACTDW